MKNSLDDLNNILFEQIERLNDDEIMNSKTAARECARAKATSNIARQIIENAKVQLEAFKYFDEFRVKESEVPEVLISAARGRRSLLGDGR